MYGKPEYNPNWDGLKHGGLNKYGYMRITINHKRVLEHRIIMGKIIGRPLTRKEKVHHINGIRHDNRLENLELFKNHSDHMHYRHPHNKRIFIDWINLPIPPKDSIRDEIMQCIVPNCNRTEHARHLCNKHFVAYRRYILSYS